MVVPVLEPVTAKFMEGGCTWGDATKDLVKNEMRFSAGLLTLVTGRGGRPLLQ
jgi:hypothetical protein